MQKKAVNEPVRRYLRLMATCRRRPPRAKRNLAHGGLLEFPPSVARSRQQFLLTAFGLIQRTLAVPLSLLSCVGLSESASHQEP